MVIRMSVTQNIKGIFKELGNTKLVCVTKTVEPERINKAIRAGATVIGENRIQEFEDKCGDILPCEKHFIGHLQSNKAKKAVEYFDVIQSVDSIKIIENINSKAEDIAKIQNVFLQINIGNEPQKFGFKIDEVGEIIEYIHSLKNVKVKGLMCIPPFLSPEDTRPYFKKMKEIFDEMQQYNQDNIDIRELSMGMSNDYIVAIEEGATMVRIGSAIFGDRKY